MSAPPSPRPDLVAAGGERLGRMVRFQIRAIRSTFEPGAADVALRWCQRHLGANWITFVTKNLRTEHGLERLPVLDPDRSFICVSNHRSFFDLYVVTSILVKHGLPHRLVFPVRSEFFYDSALGLFVNGAMSFFAMYPPVFRGRRLAALNVVGLDELVWMLKRGGVFLGIHPEGTRKRDGDPYSFLPAQSGVGRIIHHARCGVIPVFTNGLLQENLPKQIRGNFDGTGPRIHTVFGRLIDFADLLDRPGSPRVYKAIADRTLEVIGELGREEKRLRR